MYKSMGGKMSESMCHFSYLKLPEHIDISFDFHLSYQKINAAKLNIPNLPDVSVSH